MRSPRVYLAMFRQWIDIARGRSYQHVPQAMGRVFRADSLHGYFNDLTHKVDWDGLETDNGIPQAREVNGERVTPPILVLQKGLGHWDTWLLQSRQRDRDRFLRIADWALQQQDREGGWRLRPRLQQRLATPYSAMAQGEGVSVLVRAFQITEDPRYLDAAHRAGELLVKPIAQGGVARHTAEGLVLEEFPMDPPNTVLNGWVFSLMGLRDLTLVSGESRFDEALDSTVEALQTSLDKFDGGYWSIYDTKGNIASPFYHDLHIAQLKGLAAAFPERASDFDSFRQRFESQKASVFSRLRAIGGKVVQRIQNPTNVIQ